MPLPLIIIILLLAKLGIPPFIILLLLLLKLLTLFGYIGIIPRELVGMADVPASTLNGSGAELLLDCMLLILLAMDVPFIDGANASKFALPLPLVLMLLLLLVVAADVECDDTSVAKVAELSLNGSKNASDVEAAVEVELTTEAGVSKAPKSSKSTTAAGDGATVGGVCTGCVLSAVVGADDGVDDRTVVDDGTTSLPFPAAPMTSVPRSLPSPPPPELSGSL